MGSTIRKLFFLLVLSTLTLPAAGTTIKTRYVIDDGQGFWSSAAPYTGEAAEGNPSLVQYEMALNNTVDSNMKWL